ncbi:hypothetical protein D5R81_09630 [Parashewanella spongiae]|uniref:Uncharacterized protein n=1 Tax=Parashewanella spongiae TaxID=342950 RepID=A0A3A6TWZ0_9GAMM|nr:HNH endonuclease domain-containing protein [Parashewanella spongiae]MCL1078147.1 hypothetical protein [Parashewanella spongiae]RJY16340.1 hypothetical protein D5R81_09630 [Parashewanella spongiae]
MPLINNQIKYNELHSLVIEDKLSDEDFKHQDWSKDDLQEVRSTIRAFYRNEQRGICAYCKEHVSLVAAGNANIEHIAPKSLYPNFIFEPKNLCVICCDCNQIKKDQEVLDKIPNTVERQDIKLYPRSSGAFKVVHPFFDNYDEHIIIKGKLYIDLTDKGHFTIGACKLNRYTRQFGVEQEFIDDDEITALMNEFMESKSSIQKAKILQKISNVTT